MGADVGERLQRARTVLLRWYVELRAERYELDPALGYADEDRVSWRPLCTQILRWVDTYRGEGENWDEALERVCRAALKAWLRKPGHNNWLVTEHHPLSRMHVDLDWIAGELRLSGKRKAAKPASQAARCHYCDWPENEGHSVSCRRPRDQQEAA